MVFFQRLCALLLSLCLLVAPLTGCSGCSSQSGVESGSASSGQDSVGSESDSFPSLDPSTPLEEAIAANPDAIGWLTVPGTTVDEVVVQGKDNDYYLRRDAKKSYNYAGCLFLDYRAKINPISQNLVIYGHNLGVPWGRRDEPNSVKFAQLLKFADERFAREHPYLYFSTPEQQYTYQIFAVYYAEAYTTPVEYHHASYSPDEYTMLINDSKARSLYNYKVSVYPGEKLLTLSTCSYKYGTYSQNPNQRFVVVGRLVRPDERYSDTVSLTKNDNPKKPSFLQ